MMAAHPAPPAETLELTVADMEIVDRLVEERLAARFETESFFWRFRLISVETFIMGALVLVAGLLLKQPTMMVLRASVLVAATCFATGLTLLLLSAWAARTLTRLRQWWRR
ncbi:hypothetical protein [Sphingopyxis sp. P1IMeth2]|uniref:hypothetical protein n=1 Tax=Sphingopyxis sp. P1IMeth2 TaxID=1892848 RepID=UPI0021B3F214|nr:hypothetical protein [Sphingopyxis sp. P1IMeth2]